MAKNVLFIGWTRPARGREAAATEVFQSCLNYLETKQKEKAIDRFEPIFLVPHGGDLNGFILVHGSSDKLAKIRWDDRFLDILTAANFNVDGFGTIDGWSGEGVPEMMARWQKHITK